MTFEDLLNDARVWINREPTDDEIRLLRFAYNMGYVACQIEYVPLVEDTKRLLRLVTP